MPWSEPEKWLSVPIIGLMLGFFWKGISNKKDQIDDSLSGFVTEKFCLEKQKNVSLRLEVVIKDEIKMLKDETFQHMRDIEAAVNKLEK